MTTRIWVKDGALLTDFLTTLEWFFPDNKYAAEHNPGIPEEADIDN